MTPYQLLRDEAAAKRDKIVSEAHIEFRRTCEKIEALRLNIGSATVEGERSVKQLVADCIPKGERFTYNDILRSLELAHPGRDFRKATVNTIIYKLGNAGIIKRISKDGRGQITWGDMSCEGELSKERPLHEVVAEVMNGNPSMLIVDIAMGVQKTGRLAHQSGKSVCRSISKVLYANPQLFSKDRDGKWATCNAQ